MLYVNNQFLDLSKDSPYREQYEMYKKQLLTEYGFPVVIKTRKEPVINPTGVMEAPMNIMIPASSVVKDINGYVEWRYTPSHPRMVNGTLEYPLKRIFIKENNIFEEKDIDLVIYLVYLSSFGVKEGYLYIENKKREADDYARIRGQLSAVTFYLYDSSSPLQDADIRTIALALGISNADNAGLTTNQVRMMIEEAVKEGELTGSAICNYEKFKEHALVGERTKLLANIQRLLDSQRIRYDITSSTFILLDEAGNDVEQLFKISPHDYKRRIELFANFIKTNKKVANIFRDIIGEDVVGTITQYTKEELEEKPLQELRVYGKNIGVKKSFFMKKDELINAILETYKE